MSDVSVGGQAVIEGVMMRSKDRVATAVRKPNGEIMVKTESYRALANRHKLFNIPIVRGAIAFVEMMILGMRTLNFSAEVAIEEAEKEEAARSGEQYTPRRKKTNGILLGLTAVAALAVGFGLFVFVPLAVAEAITSWLHVSKEALGFNLIAGAVRLALFLGYVWGISYYGEFRRVFEYHGAEHKSIYTYEMGQELTPESASLFTRFHPRCGTSFILIVVLLAILVYSVSDSIYAQVVGYIPWWLERAVFHLTLLPLVAGASYELLKLSGKTRDNIITRILIQPGLWLQRITTKEPTPDQLEVALAALEASLGLTESKLTSRRIPVS